MKGDGRGQQPRKIDKDAVLPDGEYHINRLTGTKGGPGNRSRSRNRPKRENKNTLLSK